MPQCQWQYRAAGDGSKLSLNLLMIYRRPRFSARVVNHVQADGGVSHDTNEMVKNIEVECTAKGPGELRIANSRLSFISVVSNVYSMAIYLIV